MTTYAMIYGPSRHALPWSMRSRRTRAIDKIEQLQEIRIVMPRSSGSAGSRSAARKRARDAFPFAGRHGRGFDKNRHHGRPPPSGSASSSRHRTLNRKTATRVRPLPHPIIKRSSAHGLTNAAPTHAARLLTMGARSGLRNVGKTATPARARHPVYFECGGGASHRKPSAVLNFLSEHARAAHLQRRSISKNCRPVRPAQRAGAVRSRRSLPAHVREISRSARLADGMIFTNTTPPAAGHERGRWLFGSR